MSGAVNILLLFPRQIRWIDSSSKALQNDM